MSLCPFRLTIHLARHEAEDDCREQMDIHLKNLQCFVTAYKAFLDSGCQLRNNVVSESRHCCVYSENISGEKGDPSPPVSNLIHMRACFYKVTSFFSRPELNYVAVIQRFRGSIPEVSSWDPHFSAYRAVFTFHPEERRRLYDLYDLLTHLYQPRGPKHKPEKMTRQVLIQRAMERSGLIEKYAICVGSLPVLYDSEEEAMAGMPFLYPSYFRCVRRKEKRLVEKIDGVFETFVLQSRMKAFLAMQKWNQSKSELKAEFAEAKDKYEHRSKKCRKVLKTQGEWKHQVSLDSDDSFFVPANVKLN